MPGGSHTDNVIDTPATRFRFQALQRPTSVERPTSSAPNPTVPIYSTFTPSTMDERILCRHVLRLIGTFAECV
ncbi:hypothetical protein M5D96_007078 [Drosophila gunungcola]|uniref:Uncharacterized protein n=1 Tax=Drosophila gunungcola TaxID=103775 RepID=A0A9P9YMW2_9MUSC|nr:hypothetical protein M5D96_007078 [Drosophila gunungcola]